MSFNVGGVPFESLPPSDLTPTGYLGSRPYWDFGTARVTDLRDASALGNTQTWLAGYAGATPFTAARGVSPALPSASTPLSYSIPSIADSPFDVAPADGDLMFELSGLFGGAMVRAVTPAQVVASPSSAVVEGSVIEASTMGAPMDASSWGKLIVLAVILWAIFQQE
jgi:hypothetical protein